MKGRNDFEDQPESILEILEDGIDQKGPPIATLAKRAKSYSDFYEVCSSYLGRSAEIYALNDVFIPSNNSESEISFESNYDRLENDLLDASLEDYQYVQVSLYWRAY